METLHQICFSNAENMEAIDSESINLVVTSPPYPMIEMWDQSFSAWDANIAGAINADDGNRAFSLMHQCLDRVWRQLQRVVAEGGIVCVNIGDAVRTIKGNFKLYPNHVRIISIFNKLGFSLLPVIIWRKPTNSPNKFMGSGMLPPNAYITLEHEYILVFRKKTKRSVITDIEKNARYESAYFWEERNKWFSDVWTDLVGSSQKLANGENRSRGANYPLELPYRLIQMFSIKGDRLLDPFLGTGTTMIAAMCSGRSCIGYELDSSFKPVILQKISTLRSLSQTLFQQRLQAHGEFIRSRAESNKQLKHRHVEYNFPVITKQETRIQFDLADQIQYLSADRFTVSYNSASHEIISEILDQDDNESENVISEITPGRPDQLKLF